jgi:hypothetical protein
MWLRIEKYGGCCEDGNKLSGFVKHRKLLDQLRNVTYFKEGRAHGVSVLWYDPVLFGWPPIIRRQQVAPKRLTELRGSQQQIISVLCITLHFAYYGLSPPPALHTVWRQTSSFKIVLSSQDIAQRQHYGGLTGPTYHLARAASMSHRPPPPPPQPSLQHLSSLIASIHPRCPVISCSERVKGWVQFILPCVLKWYTACRRFLSNINPLDRKKFRH